MPKHTFVLVGPHAGKTIQFREYQFKEGVFVFEGSADEATRMARVLRQWGAFPEAEAADLEMPPPHAGRDGGIGGKPNSGEATKEQASGVPPESPETAETPSAETAPTESTAAEQKPDLAEAIGLLDAGNDEHWTSNNLPAVDILSDMTGTRVARADVEGLAPGYTRAKARES